MDANDRVTVTWHEIELFGNLVADEIGKRMPNVDALRARYILAIALLQTLPMRAREDAADLALEGEVPWPPAISGTHRLAWAREWCADQPSATLKAYTLAGFEAMRPADRAAFLAHVASEAAA
jgi:hypothetical protein